MTTLPQYTPSYGGGQVPNPANVIKTSGAPSSKLTEDRIGILAVDNAAGVFYGLASKSGGTDDWVPLGGSGVIVSTLTGDTGTATPSAGNIKIAGTANEITTAASGSTVTLSLPTSLITPGSVEIATGNLTVDLGNILLAAAGAKFLMLTGSNAAIGVSGNMSGSPGTVTVSTTAVSSGSQIFYCRATTGGTPGQVSITSQTAETGFVLTSTGNETSTFNWLIIN